MQKSAHCINKNIRAKEVRLINENDEKIGIVSLVEALEKTEAAGEGFDLVEINPNVDPPVCRIMNLGKQKYKTEKEKRDQKKKQKVTKIKEIKFKPSTEKHDYDVKIVNAKRFLEAGNKVKVSMMFRGREIVHYELGEKKLKDFINQHLADFAILESPLKLAGRQLIGMLAPNKPKKV